MLYEDNCPRLDNQENRSGTYACMLIAELYALQQFFLYNDLDIFHAGKTMSLIPLILHNFFGIMIFRSILICECKTTTRLASTVLGIGHYTKL